MPSGPPELHEKWGDLNVALTYLIGRGFKDNAGLILPPPGKTELVDDEASAIDYLCLEWDFSWDGLPDY